MSEKGSKKLLHVEKVEQKEKNLTGLEKDRNSKRMEEKKHGKRSLSQKMQACPCRDAEASEAEV